MTKYIIDAHSWISYLEGNSQGEKLNSLLKEDNEIYVLPITISEVISKVKRKKGNIITAYNSIISHSQIIEMTPKIAKEAGILHAEIRKKIESFGIVDAIIISCAKSTNSIVVTGDNHFKNFKEVLLLK